VCRSAQVIAAIRGDKGGSGTSALVGHGGDPAGAGNLVRPELGPTHPLGRAKAPRLRGKGRPPPAWDVRGGLCYVTASTSITNHSVEFAGIAPLPWAP
jgi:hypothetical protein